jgi:hypothetical protein
LKNKTASAFQKSMNLPAFWRRLQPGILVILDFDKHAVKFYSQSPCKASRRIAENVIEADRRNAGQNHAEQLVHLRQTAKSSSTPPARAGFLPPKLRPQAYCAEGRGLREAALLQKEPQTLSPVSLLNYGLYRFLCDTARSVL